MKWLVLAIAGLLAAPTAAAAATKSYAVQPFERISVSAGIELQAQVGPPQSVVAETDGSDFEDLAIDVKGGELTIGRPFRWFWFGLDRGPGYRVRVTVPALHGLHASSGASGEVTGPVSGVAAVRASSSGRAQVSDIEGSSVALHASSSGSLKVGRLQGSAVDAHASSSGHIAVGELRSNAVSIRASSSGGVEAAGSCETLSVSPSSGGRVLASALQCANVLAHASSGGGIQAFASKSLNAQASSGGHISVGGKPTQVQMDQSSGGTIDVGR